MAVPEDHARPDGPTVAIHVAVIPSLARRKEGDPVVLLAGGPGQAASDLGRMAEALSAIRRTRDIVLVDQRGTGLSRTLTCPALSAPLPDDAWNDPRYNDEALMRAEWQRCIAELQGNPRTHRTDDYVADLERVRGALGARQFNLWGGSYGSRVALRYMQLHPQAIRSSVLDGVAPTSLKLPQDILAHTEALLRDRFAACGRQQACADTHGNLSARFDELLATLSRTPAKVRLPHPATGRPIDATIDDRGLLALLWPLLYTPETFRLVPQMIQQAAAGDFAALVTSTAGRSSRDFEFSPLLRVAVLCAEDMAGHPSAQAGRWQRLEQLFLDACRDFPAGQAPADFFAPTRSDVPTLLVSGSLDPVTPPSEAERAARTLMRHRHVIVEGWGHIVSHHPCVRRAVVRFIETADPQADPLACEAELKLPDPLFYVTNLVAK